MIDHTVNIYPVLDSMKAINEHNKLLLVVFFRFKKRENMPSLQENAISLQRKAKQTTTVK